MSKRSYQHSTAREKKDDANHRELRRGHPRERPGLALHRQCQAALVSLEPRVLNEDLDRIIGKAGLRRVRLHDLRHACASFLLVQGVHRRIVMELCSGILKSASRWKPTATSCRMPCRKPWRTSACCLARQQPWVRLRVVIARVYSRTVGKIARFLG